VAGRPETFEQLTAYLDGELSDAERAAVEQWLAVDADARRMLEELRRTARLVGSLPRERTPAGMSDALRARLERASLLGEAAGALPRSRTSWLRPVALAASIMLVCTVGFLGMTQLQKFREERLFGTASEQVAVRRTARDAKRAPPIEQVALGVKRETKSMPSAGESLRVEDRNDSHLSTAARIAMDEPSLAKERPGEGVGATVEADQRNSTGSAEGRARVMTPAAAANAPAKPASAMHAGQAASADVAGGASVPRQNAAKTPTTTKPATSQPTSQPTSAPTSREAARE